MEAVRDLTNFASYQLLCRILEDLVAAGRMPAERRPAAPVAAWAAVHGLATLLLDGPLAHLPEAAQHDTAAAAVELIIAGLTAQNAGTTLPTRHGDATPGSLGTPRTRRNRS